MPHTALPSFSNLQPEQQEKKLKVMLEQNRAKIKKILATQPKKPSWSSLMEPLEQLDNALHQFWSPFSHLHAVKSSDALRQAYEKCIPLLTAYSNEVGQNKALFHAVEKLRASSPSPAFTPEQQRILDNDMRDFTLAGVALNKEDQTRYRELSEQLAQLSNQFADNTLDATQAFLYHTEDSTELEGLPELALEQARMLAKQKKVKGYAFSLDAPSYLPIMQHAQSRELRKTLHHAYQTRASELGPHAGAYDNTAVMQAILEARVALAGLLDYGNYADYALATKMIQQTEDVLTFLNDLVEKSLGQAKKEYATLRGFAQEKLGLDKLEAWDVAYASEQLRVERYAISDTVLRPYFPAPKVVEGLFAVLHKLFNLTVHRVEEADVWDEQVQCFAVHQEDEPIAYFYMDLYTREHKRGGAWMDDCQIRCRLPDGSIQLPIAMITCNFNPPLEDQPALLSHNDVITLFHECGHALQHMLTTMEHSAVSGINAVPWDAVEVPSQWLENWAWSREGLNMISAHVDTGEPLPDALFQKMLDAKHFQSALGLMRQLEFALFDFELHLSFRPKQKKAVQKTLDAVRKKVSVLPVPSYSRFAHSFGHIFAGGYAAGYYSYLWAEVMAQDAFSLFEENGLFDFDTSDAFRSTFLACGGSRDPLDLFVQFRGRKPSIHALLRAHGIKETP